MLTAVDTGYFCHQRIRMDEGVANDLRKVMYGILKYQFFISDSGAGESHRHSAIHTLDRWDIVQAIFRHDQLNRLEKNRVLLPDGITFTGIRLVIQAAPRFVDDAS